MYQKDIDLGNNVAKYLVNKGIENPIGSKALRDSTETISGAMMAILHKLNLDATSEDIKDTPKRVAKMYSEELFYGLSYDNFPKCTVTPNHTKAKAANNGKVYDEMVLENGITVHSMCEHHFIPFIGTASVAYIPHKHLLGLSKLNRVVDFFSRRPQVQERLTAQICASLQFILDTPDVAVVVKAEHLCVKLRGIKHQGCNTVTSQLGGRFMDNPALRSEFLSLARS